MSSARQSRERRHAATHSQRRWRWWELPLDDPPDRIVIRNIVRDETIVVRLDGDPACKKRKPTGKEPAARMWWDEET